MERLPTLFLSHGSPMHALEPGRAGAAWQALAQSLARPRAILVASAHWETSLPMLSGAQMLETMHDFGGFPEALYKLRYDVPGSPEVAREASALLHAAGFTASVNGSRGIDHGAWVPLRWMYPGHDVPVVQLSVQPGLGTAHHLALGRALAPLAASGVLLIGSGHVTHNLGDWFNARGKGEALPYVSDFSEWLAAKLVSGDESALLDYRRLAPGAVRAHPTEEHFLPLFVAYGAAGPGARATRVHRDVDGPSLAMDAYRFDADARQ